MKNFDPYKRTILFVASFINVCLMTVLFVHVWYNYYQQTMYVIQFYRKGNYVIFMLYALLLFFFSNMYENRAAAADRGDAFPVSEPVPYQCGDLHRHFPAGIWLCLALPPGIDDGGRDGGFQPVEYIGD